MEDMHVIANLFLDKDYQECCEKTKDKRHEPERIYTDMGC